MGSIEEKIFRPKKYSTEITDYAAVHASKAGPYAENLEVDALVVGAGFGKFAF
jgi:hypothetical protein